MRRYNDSKSKGFFHDIPELLYVLFFAGLAAYSVIFLGPQLERHLESEVCREETIVEERKWRSDFKTVICVDKKTGKKINVSTYQFFQFCPTALIFFVAVIIRLFLGLFLKLANAPKKDGTQ